MPPFTSPTDASTGPSAGSVGPPASTRRAVRSSVTTVAVRTRRLLARRPWMYWCVVAVVALAVAASMLARVDRIDAARATWGTSRTVLVATRDIAPGDQLADATTRRSVPEAVVPAAALADPPAGAVARRRVGVGEILTDADLAPATGALALVPAGSHAVPVVETVPSGAGVGDVVQVVAEGVELATAATVVAVEPSLLVAIRATDAPAVAGAEVVLVRVPSRP